MKRSITPEQIKQTNQDLIYQFIYHAKKVTQLDISYELRLSRPTVTTNLNRLVSEGMVHKDGQVDSELSGRKPNTYSIVPDYRLSIGVDIRKNAIRMVVVNLYGEKLNRTLVEMPFENSERYFRNVCKEVIAFKDASGLHDDQILGVGFAMPGLVSADRKQIAWGKTLDCTGLHIDVFSSRLPWPCCFIHDADSAAQTEMWVWPELQNAVYLMLGRHLGAAVIHDGKLLVGKHGHSSTIEHIQLNPNGKECYCGKHGCIETFCSLSALLHPSQTLEDFFLHKNKGNCTCQKQWDSYILNLAKTINMVHLIYDTDFILGGDLAPYLCEEDVQTIYKHIEEMTPFEENSDFLYISRMPKHNVTIGAALVYVDDYLRNAFN